MVEKIGADKFPFGPPIGTEKFHNAHRAYVWPKLGSRMQFLAKKMREIYMRDAYFSTEKIYIDPISERRPEDTIEKLHSEKLIPALIEERDEFPDLDLVFPHRVPFTMMKTDHGLVRPYAVRYKGEEFLVSVKEIKKHLKTREPILLILQRFIPGRPNLVTVPLIPVNEDRSLHLQSGCMFEFFIEEIQCWTYKEHYPALIEVDCADLSPNLPVKLGDVE
jgi:hypothetical protein